MATIVEFRTSAPARRSASNARGASGSTAEIVFFPGVRYERWEEAAQESKPKRKPKKRDNLVLRD